ncbi:MAG: hypothetical protein P1U63_08345 [Coxiellaceae bacterium]|nr:hypothetical protein [Coxiellaceae bacterium]
MRRKNTTGQPKGDIFSPLLTENSSKAEPNTTPINPAQVALNQLNAKKCSRATRIGWAVLCCIPTCGGSIGGFRYDDQGEPIPPQQRACSLLPSCLSPNENQKLEQLRVELTTIEQKHNTGNYCDSDAKQETVEAIKKLKDNVGEEYKTACEIALQKLEQQDSTLNTLSEVTYAITGAPKQ